MLGKIAAAAVSGLYYLKAELNIMHRDIKPANVLVSTTGAIRLCDLGVSTSLKNSFAKSKVGTVAYLAPERVAASESDEYTVTADVWSLGMTVLEMAIGHFPYASRGTGDESNITLFKLMEIIVRQPSPTLPADGGFSPAFHDFINACLTKDPEARPRPRDLLEFDFVADALDDTETDVGAWIRSVKGIPSPRARSSSSTSITSSSSGGGGGDDTTRDKGKGRAKWVVTTSSSASSASSSGFFSNSKDGSQGGTPTAEARRGKKRGKAKKGKGKKGKASSTDQRGKKAQKDPRGNPSPRKEPRTSTETSAASASSRDGGARHTSSDSMFGTSSSSAATSGRSSGRPAGPAAAGRGRAPTFSSLTDDEDVPLASERPAAPVVSGTSSASSSSSAGASSARRAGNHGTQDRRSHRRSNRRSKRKAPAPARRRTPSGRSQGSGSYT